MSQNYFLHSRPRSGLGTQTGGMGGSCPPYKFAVFLLNTKQMRHFIRGVYTPLFSNFVGTPTPAKAGGLSHERSPSGFPAAQRVRVGLGGERDKRAAGMEGENLH